MKIAKNTVVSFDYTLKNDNGDVLDSSEGGQPLAYLHGSGNIIPGLEQALEGREAGDAFQVSLEPADAYGDVDEELTQVVPRNLFQGVDQIEVGMQFQAQTAEGVQVVRIAAVEGDDVTIDANHPLAGERLHFDVNVAEVREASSEELEHGHVHVEGGCGH